MKKMQQGFSLVELVIVIVVVGLLAVAALPRFLDVTDEAKKASIEGVAGGFATGYFPREHNGKRKPDPPPISTRQSTMMVWISG